MTNDLVMFILQGLLGAFMLGFGIILNGLRSSLEAVNTDLKGLNNAVLGQYMTRDASDRKWEAQRQLDHELRGMLQEVLIRMARHEGVPYTGPGEGKS